MIWIISAVVLGLILGVIGYYFSKTALTLLVGILAGATLFVPSEFTHFNMSGKVFLDSDGYAYLGEKLASLPEYIQWAGLLFVIFFFVARIITWLLARLNLLPEMNRSDVDRLQRGIEEYGYDRDEHTYY